MSSIVPHLLKGCLYISLNPCGPLRNKCLFNPEKRITYDELAEYVRGCITNLYRTPHVCTLHDPKSPVAKTATGNRGKAMAVVLARVMSTEVAPAPSQRNNRYQQQKAGDQQKDSPQHICSCKFGVFYVYAFRGEGVQLTLIFVCYYFFNLSSYFCFGTISSLNWCFASM